MTEQSSTNENVNTQAATRAAYNAATTTLRNNNREEFNQYMLEETAKRGLEWQPRLSPAEKARQDIARLAKEHGIAVAFQVETTEDAQDNVEIRQAVVAAAAEEIGDIEEEGAEPSVGTVVVDAPDDDPQAHSARINAALTSAAVQSQVTSF